MNKDLQQIVLDHQGQMEAFNKRQMPSDYRQLTLKQKQLQRELLNAGVINKSKLMAKLQNQLFTVETKIREHQFYVQTRKDSQLHEYELAYLKKYIREHYD